jgi:hypothetical protein
MEKAIIQNNNNKKFNLLGKVLDLFLWCPILVLAFVILGSVEKGAATLVRQLEGFAFFSVFLFLMGCLLQVGIL